MGQVQVVATAFVCFFFLFILEILFMSHFTGTNKDMGPREDAGALLTKLTEYLQIQLSQINLQCDIHEEDPHTKIIAAGNTGGLEPKYSTAG